LRWREKRPWSLTRPISKALQKVLVKDGELMLQLVLAEKLGKTLSELRETITPQELLIWHAFFSERADQEREMMEKAKRRR
jgi:hypothetical protein